jgi:hypothetical protein
MVFVELVVELVDFGCDLAEGFFAGRGDFVDAALAAGGAVEVRLEQAGTFHAMQEGIEGAGADAIAVVGELVHHGEAEDGLVRGVNQHMDANEAVIEFALVTRHTFEYTVTRAGAGCLLSKSDI